MQTIATINFKGGVGKTTITWLLARYVASLGQRVLVVDIDPQMSLTLAVQLEEDGRLERRFEKWYNDRHLQLRRTMVDALAQYKIRCNGHLDFPVDQNFIYTHSYNLDLVPSVVDLYWLELDYRSVNNFITALLNRIDQYTQYDYVFFDCPPSFTPLSYSVLSRTDIVLIPVNPDVFAARGVKIMLEGFQHRLQPWHNPKIAVFMNKVRLFRDHLTKEASGYWAHVRAICYHQQHRGLSVRPLASYIPQRTDIKRAIARGNFPTEYTQLFINLWNELMRYCNEPEQVTQDSFQVTSNI